MKRDTKDKAISTDKLALRHCIENVVDTIVLLTELNVRGGYYDHLCLDEIRRPFKDANLDILYDAQKILNLIGDRRMKLKNRLDKQLQKLLLIEKII